MADSNWAHIKEIVDTAIGQKPEERAVYLAEVCKDNEETRREVESLLSSFGKADGFMDEPAIVLDSETARMEMQTLPAGQMVGRYEIVRRLGWGGMGAVYLAKDGKLDRKVAIKVLNKRCERSEENIRRFVREAKAASALNHPNILTIHEIDELDGSKYIVSEFVEGDTLRDLFKKESLELNKIIDITKQIAGALGAAHKARIVHRDIKPENIIIREDGYIKVLDFGLAKLLPQHSANAFDDKTLQQNETAKGLILGTVSYMSPEQARGSAVDERTDIFSLGVVLYEMIAGRTPFTGDTMSETFANLINKEPEPLSRFVSGLSEEMERIVLKMLRKDPELRYQTMGDCIADLKNISISLGHDSPFERTSESEDQKTAAITRTTGDHANTTAETSGIYIPWYKRIAILAAIVVVLSGFGAVGWWWFIGSDPRSSTTTSEKIGSLAILPLRSLDSGDNYLGFGISDAVIRRISQTGKVIVRPTSAVRRYLSEETDAIMAAKQLSADAVLEGTVQRVGDRVRISVNLLRTGDGISLWAESFDTKMSDIFAVQDAVAEKIVSGLRIQLDPTQKSHLTKRNTSNPIAYEFYIKGVYSFDQKGFGENARAQIDATIDLFKKAVEADPNFALARAKLAEAYIWKGSFIATEDQEKLSELGKEEIRKAEALEPQLPETHLARVWMLFGLYGGYDIEAAAKEALKAMELDPGIGHGEVGDIFLHLGLEDLSIREFERALEIDPTGAYNKRELMITYVLLNRWDDYLSAKQKYFPEEPIIPEYYLAKGDIGKAEPLIEKRSDRMIYDIYKTDGKPLLLALKGEKAASEKLITEYFDKIDRRRPDYHHITYEFAQVYAINGNVAEAVKWLRETASTGNPSYEMFARDPFLDPIRRSPEFAQFMANLKPQYDKYRSEFH